jgi:hypothetical protein
MNHAFLAPLSDSDLLKLHDALVVEIKMRRAVANKTAKAQFRVGDNVKFANAKLGRDVSGVITKIATKFITIKTGDAGNWRVPAGRVQPVAVKF